MLDVRCLQPAFGRFDVQKLLSRLDWPLFWAAAGLELNPLAYHRGYPFYLFPQQIRTWDRTSSPDTSRYAISKFGLTKIGDFYRILPWICIFHSFSFLDFLLEVKNYAEPSVNYSRSNHNKNKIRIILNMPGFFLWYLDLIYIGQLSVWWFLVPSEPYNANNGAYRRTTVYPG